MDLKFVWLLLANVLFILLIRFTRNRKKLNGILTVLFTTLITLTVIEGAYRIFFKKRGFSETGNFGASFNTPVELTGFTIKNIPDLEVIKKDPKGNLIYDAHYSIIPDSGFNKLPINHRTGYRVTNSPRDSTEIIFLGCSFTFATGIPDTATMAYLVGKEYNYNSFSRSFILPENIMGEVIKAKYEDGILKLSLPKKAETKKISKQKQVMVS